MVRNRLAEYIDYSIVGASGVSAVCALGGALYAFPWSGCTPRTGAAREYNVLWGVRVSMQLTAMAWLLSPLIQLHETWSPYIPILDGLGWSPSVLCRLFPVARFGWFEPFFLLTSLLTFKHSLRKDNRDGYTKTLQRCNRRIVAKAALGSVPVLIVQLFLALATVIGGEDATDGSSFLDATLSTHTSHDYECDGGTKEDHQDGCILCVFSLFSTTMSLAFVVYYLWRMWQVTSEMAHIALNHSLEERIRVFRYAVTGLLLLGLMFRAFSVLAEPKDAVFELLRLGDFLAVVLVVAAASAMLVIRPVRDARMADKNVSDAVLDSAQDFLGSSETLISRRPGTG